MKIIHDPLLRQKSQYICGLESLPVDTAYLSDASSDHGLSGARAHLLCPLCARHCAVFWENRTTSRDPALSEDETDSWTSHGSVTGRALARGRSEEGLRGGKRGVLAFPGHLQDSAGPESVSVRQKLVPVKAEESHRRKRG